MLPALLLLACASEEPSLRQLPLIQARARCGAAELTLEVAADEESRARGLMFRRELAPGAGMLFLYPTETRGAFWMRNTFLPLSIAFLDRSGGIVGLYDMAPFDETPVGPDEAFLSAIEVPQGWFAAQGVHEGDHCELDLPADLVAG